MQREVLRLFLDAFDSSDTPLQAFILRSIKHHVALAQQEDVPLHEDELIMRALSNSVSIIIAHAVKGIGIEVLQEAIDKCEAAGEWWAAAQLWYAAGTLHGQRAQAELKRAWAAIGKLPETDESRALEGRVLTNLLPLEWSTQVKERMIVLSQLAASDTSSDDPKYETLLNGALAGHMGWLHQHGLLSYTPLRRESLSQDYAVQLENTKEFERVARIAPDEARRLYWMCHPSHHGMSWPRLHLLPEFDHEEFVGKCCSKLVHSIEAYDFDKLHQQWKSSGVAIDIQLFGFLETGVLLWGGDAEVAKSGWRKQIEARKRIKTLVQTGERTWGEYLYEELVCGIPTVVTAGVLAFGDMDLLRELFPHTFVATALHDPLVASEMEQTITGSNVFWQGPDGYCFVRVETMKLQACALAAIIDDREVDAEALRAWLPRPDELIYIAEREFLFCAFTSGAAHPALLCATVYATRLGAWDDAEAIVNGVLVIPPLGDGKGFGMQPLVRIEAWRLLARCRGARGEAAGACEALEQAASESRAASYVWMEAASLKDMLEWVEGDAEASAQVQSRIDAVTSGFGRS